MGGGQQLQLYAVNTMAMNESRYAGIACEPYSGAPILPGFYPSAHSAAACVIPDRIGVGHSSRCATVDNDVCYRTGYNAEQHNIHNIQFRGCRRKN